MKTKLNIKPSHMFHTPENWHELMKWIDLHTDAQERIHIMTGACMAWNLACSIVGSDDDT